jgi:hypothetical protein
MKLIEIKGTKSLEYTDANELVKKLLDQGFFKKKLGRGMYGIAFELPKGDVLKCWVSDHAYESFIEYCAKNKSNPYLIKPLGQIRRFPIFYHDEEYDSNEAAKAKFVRLEKLTPIKSLEDFGYNDSSKSKAEKFLDSLQYIAIHQGMEDIPEIDGSDGMLKWVGLDPTKSTPQFQKNIIEIGKVIVHIRHETDMGELDLQLGNFGMRGKQIVLMDPVKDEFGDGDLIKLDSVLKKE